MWGNEDLADRAEEAGELVGEGAEEGGGHMSETIEIEVTQQDIDRGKPGDFTACAIARAIRRQTHRRAVCVGPEYAYAGGVDYVPVASRRWQRFIYVFDNGRPVKPTRFRLRVLE